MQCKHLVPICVQYHSVILTPVWTVYILLFVEYEELVSLCSCPISWGDNVSHRITCQVYPYTCKLYNITASVREEYHYMSSLCFFGWLEAIFAFCSFGCLLGVANIHGIGGGEGVTKYSPRPAISRLCVLPMRNSLWRNAGTIPISVQ